MRRAGNLLGPATEFAALVKAAQRASRGKRRQSEVNAFYFRLEDELLALQREMRTGCWYPGPYRVFQVRDPKERTIAAAPFPDRVVHHALCAAMEPRLEAVQISDSYACRVGRGTHAAVHRAHGHVRTFRYFLKLDVEKFFASVDHQILTRRLTTVIKDKQFLSCLERIIDHPVSGGPSGRGLPVGNLTSQHFANFYLAGLDHFIKESLSVGPYLRYMDDLLFFADDTAALLGWLGACQIYLANELNLRLHESATRMGAVRAGVPFLGMRLFPDKVRLSRASAVRFCRRVKRAERSYLTGSTSLNTLVDSMNSLTSWARHANTLAFRRAVLQGEGSGLDA